jgi:hypothetical protein
MNPATSLPSAKGAMRSSPLRTPLVLAPDERPVPSGVHAPSSPLRTPLVLPPEERRRHSSAIPAQSQLDLDGAMSERPSGQHRSAASRRQTVVRVTTFGVTLALIAFAAAAVPLLRLREEQVNAEKLRQQLSATEAGYAAATARAEAQAAAIGASHATIAGLKDQLAVLRDAKVKTVVKTRTVTKEVPRWVPNGSEVTVEVTGFQSMIAIRDVQLTHAYGFTDLVGIATNKSHETVSYAQLGCTFLDADGNVLANGMVNKQSWAPGQSWGFTCSAQVDAAGGILRVDEMS